MVAQTKKGAIALSCQFGNIKGERKKFANVLVIRKVFNIISIDHV